MKKEMYIVAVTSFIAGAFSGLFADKDRVIAIWPAVDGYRERVELITWRTQNPHLGCASNGFWQVSGQPRQITAYGIDKAVWPHRCAGYGVTHAMLHSASVSARAAICLGCDNVQSGAPTSARLWIDHVHRVENFPAPKH